MRSAGGKRVTVRSGWRRWSDGVDPVAAARGAWTGLGVLVLGGLSLPLVAREVPVLGREWLTVTAVIAFVVAAARIGRAAVPMAHGVLAALLSYLLVLPLVLVNPAARDLGQIGLTAATAVLVGAVTGVLAGVWRNRRVECLRSEKTRSGT